jgi:hypothetical protein
MDMSVCMLKSRLKFPRIIIGILGSLLVTAACSNDQKVDGKNATAIDPVEKVVSNPVFSILPGEYITDQRVELSSKEMGSQIYYTLDGSDPTRTSSIYTGPILLSESATIRMFAAKDGLLDSEIVSGSYHVRSMLKQMRLFLPTHYNHSVAVASDGTVYFPEYGKMRLMRQDPNGLLEPIIEQQGGMLTVFVDPKDRLYVGLDLSDEKDANGRFKGSVNRVDIGPNGKKVLTPVIRYLRRPRQMAWDGNKLYVQLEAERMIISCEVDQGSCEYPDQKNGTAKTAVIEVDNRATLPPPNGMAFRNGVFYWAETGIYQLREDKTKWIEMGRIRSKAPGKPAVTLKDGIGRTRGIGFDTAGNLYFSAESNDKDQGNSGTLARLLPDATGVISPQSKYELLLDRIDYPQFIKVLWNGEVLIPLARENFMGLYDPKLKVVKQIVPEPFIDMYAQNLSVTPDAANAKTLSFEFPEFGKKFEYLVTTESGPSLTTGWLKIKIEGLKLPKALYDKYVNYPAFPSPLIPGPGFYRIPEVTCTFAGKACTARGIVYRTQKSWRWPMYYPNGVETPAEGFSEDPDHFLFNFKL